MTFTMMLTSSEKTRKRKSGTAADLLLFPFPFIKRAQLILIIIEWWWETVFSFVCLLNVKPTHTYLYYIYIKNILSFIHPYSSNFYREQIDVTLLWNYPFEETFSMSINRTIVTWQYVDNLFCLNDFVFMYT